MSIPFLQDSQVVKRSTDVKNDMSEAESVLSASIIPEPSQQRSREALARFLSAGEKALLENRFEVTGIADFCQLADSSIGTFYRLIGDKEKLLLAVHQRFVADSKNQIDALLNVDRWRGEDLEAVVSALVDVVLATYSNREGLLRALIQRSSSDINFRERVHSLNRYVASKFIPIVMERRAQVNHPHPKLAAEFSVHVLLAALNHHTLAGLGSIGPRKLHNELVTLMLRYLGVSE